MKYFLFFLLVLVTINITACETRTETLQTIKGETMGTFYTITYLPTKNSLSKKTLFKLVEKKLHHVNQLMSSYISSSEVSKFNQFHSTKPFPISNETYKVVHYALQVSRKTQGAFDITVAPLVNLWGFGHTGRTEKIPKKKAIQQALLHIGYQKLTLLTKPSRLVKSDPFLQIDLSSIAKGYGVDEVKNKLLQQGITHGLINIGGEIAAIGKKSKIATWVIGIEKPVAGQPVQQRLFLDNITIATSGDYRNFFQVHKKHYSHTIDSQTGFPINRLQATASASVISPSCMKADAWATAFMALPYKQSLQLAKQEKLPLFLIVHMKQSNLFSIYKTKLFAFYLKTL